MYKKFDNLLFVGLHLILIVFFMYGTAVYAPESPATPVIWIIGIVVFGYIVFSAICHIIHRKTLRRIDRYYKGRY